MAKTHMYLQLNPVGKTNDDKTIAAAPTSFYDAVSGVKIVNKQIAKVPVGQATVHGNNVLPSIRTGWLVETTEETYDDSLETIEFVGIEQREVSITHTKGKKSPTVDEIQEAKVLVQVAEVDEVEIDEDGEEIPKKRKGKK